MWQQAEDGTVVRHPDGYLTLHNTPFPTPLMLAVFYVSPHQPCPFEQPKPKRQALASIPQLNPYYEKRRKCAQFRRRQFIQRREEWDQKYEERKQTRKLILEVRRQVTVTQRLRGKENARKRRAPTAESCCLDTCPKKMKCAKAERKVEKRFRKNEPKPRRFNYPGYKSSAEEEESSHSQISDVSGRRSRSPLTMTGFARCDSESI